MITTQTRSLAEVEADFQFCPICLQTINGYTIQAVRWPKVGPVLEADFRPHELIFKRPDGSA